MKHGPWMVFLFDLEPNDTRKAELEAAQYQMVRAGKSRAGELRWCYIKQASRLMDIYNLSAFGKRLQCDDVTFARTPSALFNWTGINKSHLLFLSNK